MEPDPRPEPPSLALPLIDAIVAWCDQDLVIQAKGLQSYFSNEVLFTKQLAILDRNRKVVSTPNPMDRDDHMRTMHDLRTVMELLKEDIKNLLARRKLFLRGVRVRPERTVIPEPIANEWASILRFDPWLGTVWIQQDQFGDLMVSQRPWPPSHEPAVTGEGGTVLPAMGSKANRSTDASDIVSVSTFDVATLTAEQVATLLERHAAFVCEDTGVTLLLPGKASPMALIATKMRERAKRNEMAATITEEAKWLAAWVKRAAPSYPAVGYKTISAKLSAHFKELQREFMAQSN